MSIVKVNSAQIGQSVTATNNFCWYQPSSPDGTVRLGNGNAGSVTDLVTVNSSGNVGIGTNPTSGMLLNIGGTTGASTNSMIGLSYTNTSSQLRLTWNNAGAAIIGIGGDSSGNIILGTSASLLGTSPTALATLTQSGNLGLGVTPSGWATIKPLQIGNASFSAVNDECYLMSNAYYDGSSFKRISASHGPTQYFQYAGAHQWLTAAVGAAGSAISFTQAMTLDASGNLSVGTTGLGGKLYVVSGGASSVAGRFDTGVAGDVSQAPVYIVKYDNNTTTSQGFLKFFINNGGAASGVITANGANAATFSSTSDYRLKENITALPPQLANILALKPSEFDFIDGSGHQIGFIAQEMLEVYPDCVSENEDKMLMISGWSKTEARLVKAIQELSAELNELKKRIN